MKTQEADARTINLAGRQRMLSQRIAKALYMNSLQKNGPSYELEKENVKDLMDQWKQSHLNLMGSTAEFSDNHQKLDSLFNDVDTHLMEVVNATNALAIDTNEESRKTLLQMVNHSEALFLNGMEQIVKEYQRLSEKKVKRTESVTFWLAFLALVILISEFLFILTPLFKKLEKDNRLLLENNRRLSDFAQIASHNFRAPVGNIKMLMHLYGRTEDETEKGILIEKVTQSTNRLSATMDALTDSLKVQSDHGQKLEQIKFNTVYQNVLPSFEQWIENEEAKITVDFSGLPSIRFSKIYLESIFTNMISNALKYKSPDRKLELHIKSYEKRGRKQLVFSDNGLGIDLKQHGRKIFGLNKVFHRHPDSKGVGLFMTRTQIETLGGKITVESEVNVGTTFIITF
ncbi:sensor histidine kinase [Flagellimonas pelagia]|uniref:sensor histidine kinase n=1 Tax=Flagellimonas pelagia TaxID=2306998 RepID=UPI0016051257|nr:ATP-binding protein [Allomuricauda maritima]